MDIRFTRRTALLIVCDILATFLSYYLASVLTGLVGEVFATHEIYFILGVPAVVYICLFAAFKMYNNLWEYASLDEAIQIMLAVVLSTLAGAVFLWIIDVVSAVLLWVLGEWIPIRIYFVALFLMIFFTGGVRMVFRVIRSKKRVIAATPAENQKRLRTLVVGAGETGSLAIGRMASRDPHMPGEPIIAVDDNPSKRKLRIHGVEVMGTSDDIPRLVERFDIQQIVVAIPSATLDERKRIYGICTKTNCQLRTLPNVRELRIDEINDVKLREVDVADLLGREEVVLNTRVVSGYISSPRNASWCSTCTKTTPTCFAMKSCRNTTISTCRSKLVACAMRVVCATFLRSIIPQPCSMQLRISTCPLWRCARVRRFRTTCLAR